MTEAGQAEKDWVETLEFGARVVLRDKMLSPLQYIIVEVKVSPNLRFGEMLR